MDPERGSLQCGTKEASVGLCVTPCGVMLNWSRVTRMLAMVSCFGIEAIAFGYLRER
ncbi:hypothetical protein SAMN05444170_4430 [Bradyrhizobium erythrophlei]|uniref:Uncharacterized protein n=1 Tax=Bradyrhizobium erythrophlei TaxID=1437360 RepID=A0A1M7UC95_9BRAD|nr:hypothetical protein SAMN05444170_4430 [Bradyrhizobium erythrophlei]